MKVTSGDREFDLCFMTSTWRGDLDRFALLRESLCAFGHGGVPHYALINTEDEPLLRALKLPDVVPLTTEQLLAPEVEAGRLRYLQSWGGRRWKTFKRSMNKRFGLFPDARYYGWQAQQLIKLEAPTRLPHDVCVCFDSDNVITGPYSLDEFVPEGKVALHEAEVRLAPGQKRWDWYPNAARLLDVPVLPDLEWGYVNQPVVFSKVALLALRAWIENRYGRPWYEPILALPIGAWSEFTIYGCFVRHHLKFEGIQPVPAHQDALWLFTEEQRRNSTELIRKAFADPAIRMLVLQADHHGRWPLQRFLPVLREQLAAVTQGRNLVK